MVTEMSQLPEETLEVILRYCCWIKDTDHVSDYVDHEVDQTDFPHPEGRMVSLGGGNSELLSESLVAASAVSRVFRRICIPLLYRHLVIKPCPTDENGKPLPPRKASDPTLIELLDVELQYVPELSFVRYVLRSSGASSMTLASFTYTFFSEPLLSSTAPANFSQQIALSLIFSLVFQTSLR